MKDFFKEVKLKITDINGNKELYSMEPVKVKDIPILLEIEEIYSEYKEEITEAEKRTIQKEALPHILELLEKTIKPPIKDLSISRLEPIIDEFMKFNFKDRKEGSVSKKDVLTFAEIFDLLISEGHNYNDIFEYPLPRFESFCLALIKRLTPEDQKQKKVSPLEAFSKFAAVKYR